MVTKARECETEKCYEVLRPRAWFNTCAGCRASYKRWAARRPAEVLQRRLDLNKFTNRMEEVEGTESPRRRRADA
jgi:hypothetical protein